MAQMREIKGAVVVITGASSGIGRAAARAFAKRGARVVVAARRAQVLDTVADECRAMGGEALAVRTDVTDPEAVWDLAQAALSAFGRIDVWINNAGVGVFGPFAETDIALHRRTIEVNLLGAVHGAHAVLPVFQRQGSGVLINTCSLGGWAPTPFAAAYTASKFGLRGFMAALRAELPTDSNIHVCGVFPAMVDTPGLEHGANTSGRTIDPGPFLYRAEEVADVMVGLAQRPRAEVAVGWPARAGEIAFEVAPRLTEMAIGAAFRGLLSRANPAPRTQGGLLHPVAHGREVSGGYLDAKGLPSAGRLSGGLAVLGLAGLALLLSTKPAGRKRA